MLCYLFLLKGNLLHRNMLLLSETKPTFQIIAHAALQDNITHLGACALNPVLHTNALKPPQMASAVAFDRQETVMPSLPPAEHHQFLLPSLLATNGCGIFAIFGHDSKCFSVMPINSSFLISATKLVNFTQHG